jgi:hypothetical protein
MYFIGPVVGPMCYLFYFIRTINLAFVRTLVPRTKHWTDKRKKVEFLRTFLV